MAHGLYSPGSVVVVSGLSCSTARGIFPDHGQNLCPLHWQVDSLPLDHQRSPALCFFNAGFYSLHNNDVNLYVVRSHLCHILTSFFKEKKSVCVCIYIYMYFKIIQYDNLHNNIDKTSYLGTF